MNSRTLTLLVVIFLMAGCAASPSVATSTAAPTSSSMPATPALPPGITSTPSPAPLPVGEKIIFDDSGDRELTGTLYGQGETAIILANMSLGDEAQWDPFVAAVDKEKFTTVTFNYRNINDPYKDILFILEELKEQGFARIVCIGASLGASVCTAIAREPEMAGLVLIAGSVNQVIVAEITYPKLFISAASDPLVYDIKTGFEKAAEPKTLAILEDARAHGTNMFQSSESDKFLTLLIDFVNALAE